MKTLLFQGDSITDCGRNQTGGAGYPAVGYGPGYPGLIASRLLCSQPGKWNIVNRGISGNRIVDLYARWKVDGLNLKPDVISILIGVNDTWHEFNGNNGVELPRYDEFYRRILDWTKQTLPDVKFILMEPFCLLFEESAPKKEWLDDIRQRADIVRKIAKDYNEVYVPLQARFDEQVKATSGNYWLVDGVHPTPAGHQLIMDAWMEAAKDLLK